jgi:hypothetical protein
MYNLKYYNDRGYEVDDYLPVLGMARLLHTLDEMPKGMVDDHAAAALLDMSEEMAEKVKDGASKMDKAGTDFMKSEMPSMAEYRTTSLESQDPQELDAIFGSIPEYSKALGESGRMSVQKLSLYARRKGGRIGHKWTSSEAGVIRDISRLAANDPRVFGYRSRKGLGGTVLVDTSGSMHMTHEQLEQICEAAPHATVAMYSGQSSHGTLTIIAEKGRIAKDSHIHRAREVAGGGNIVDIPALLWLSEQRAPRHWICDGYVTGIGDDHTGNLVRAAAHISQRAGITRSHDMDDFLEDKVIQRAIPRSVKAKLREKKKRDSGRGIL